MNKFTKDKIKKLTERIKSGEAMKLRIGKSEDYIIEKIEGNDYIVKLISNMIDSIYEYKNISDITWILYSGKEVKL
ncbi:MAG: hypothetical protein M0R03_03930 [Novosphingobium sp.]|nr:hypothetical protein [Novosphingobium sp.]